MDDVRKTICYKACLINGLNYFVEVLGQLKTRFGLFYALFDIIRALEPRLPQDFSVKSLFRVYVSRFLPETRLLKYKNWSWNGNDKLYEIFVIMA